MDENEKLDYIMADDTVHDDKSVLGSWGILAEENHQQELSCSNESIIVNLPCCSYLVVAPPLESLPKKRQQKQGQSASLNMSPNLSHMAIKSTFELIYIN